ncbi:MAG: dTDP-4-dehydrorhamnose 3,5-epimerase [Kiritimatiellia bacterium]
MKIKFLEIAGLAVVDTSPFIDNRGSFARFFCQGELESIIGCRNIVNINFSHTKSIGSIRGMHFQHPPKAEMKLVRCISGAVFDVAVDLRKNSPTFLRWHGELLTAENMQMLVVPEGFAHGFQTLEENSEMLYLHTEFYSMEQDAGICYHDPLIGIKWPLPAVEVSAKDQAYALLDGAFGGIKL